MSSDPRSPARTAAALTAALVAVLAVLLTAFAWPAVRSQPRDLPVALAAPPAVADRIETGISAGRSGAFEVVRVADEAAARAAVADREVSGAVVVGPDGAAVLTASAGGAAVAQTLQQLATGLSAGLGSEVAVEDVVPAPTDDPRGAGLAAGVLPLVLGGVLTAALLSRALPRTGQRAVTALAVAAGAGLALVGLLQGWLGALDGSWTANGAVLALGLAATAWTLLGLHAVAGDSGLGLGAATMVLLGNPLSGAASAPEFLPAGWAGLGQLLPPGATVSALRSVAFFDGAGAAGPLWVLTGWAALGLLLCAAGVVRERRRPLPTAPRPAGSVAA
ncbi:hypothetical protein OF117_06870 [Geodermatophilus sp. YIM 151500]|uniref:hypothetical protein n=1 Tax=Geodermatophilus sp. YIM 151500 TaxID=2984531 RepID=UPI0021E48152|nr:hypothetical protein [Geodermatophilus sp. YIM 151500]MCV2489081.1 hypothetical protein [Geodermatophilus sp. YIM 151500]